MGDIVDARECDTMVQNNINTVMQKKKFRGDNGFGTDPERFRCLSFYADEETEVEQVNKLAKVWHPIKSQPSAILQSLQRR